MKTLKKTDRKALVVVAAILAVLVLGSLTACAMQKAGAIEEGKPAPVEEVTGSSNDEGTADWGPGDEAEALVEDEAVEASEDASTHGESQAAAEAAGVPTPVAHGGNAANSTPAIQSAPSGEHKHSWVPVKGPREVIDVGAYTETQYRTEERVMCSACGEDITNGDKQGRSILQHGKAHMLAGEGGGTYSYPKKVPCGTISHPTQTHIEYEITGYKCPCGATK